MLISHRHRFVFVHIYKTAGISIVTALIPFAATPADSSSSTARSIGSGCRTSIHA